MCLVWSFLLPLILAADVLTETCFQKLSFKMAEEKQNLSESAGKPEESKDDTPDSSAVESATSEPALIDSNEASDAPDSVEPNKALPDEDDQSKGPEDSNDVITIDDGKESDISKKTISDADFFGAVTDEEKEFYRTHRHEPDEVQLMKIQCTACWKQVRLLVITFISMLPPPSHQIIQVSLTYVALEWNVENKYNQNLAHHSKLL